MRLRVYVDTTVVSAAEDVRAPDRQQRTLEFFARVDEFELMSSELLRTELLQTPDEVRRQMLLKRLTDIKIVNIDDAMQTLADQYVEASIIPIAYHDDAVHIAAAVLSGVDVLVSWNFRHLVNRR
jgi:hypothetical protein